MMSFLLAIIYIAFISLGLPDALLGSAWPSMHGALNVPVSYAGIVSMIISAGTIISSLFSDKMNSKLGTGKVTAVSVGLTAVSLLGFSVSKSFLMLCVIAFPYGLGAGAVDAALNNYVALHYKARHMSWLHCFWGVGATIGPYIMGACLTGGFKWNSGYQIIGILQVALTVILIISLPLWRRSNEAAQEGAAQNKMGMGKLLRLPGVKEVLTAFFCYCAVEQTAGLWGASYMVMERGLSPQSAAKWASLFYLGITIGRFICGFISMKMSDKAMIRLGQGMIIAGILLLIFPLGNLIMCIGLVVVGLGCAPIYPSIIHETPTNFGAGLSQALIGMQMAFAYVGTTVMPPLFGALAGKMGIWLYPFYLLIITLLMIWMVEKLNKVPKAESEDIRGR
ncbi:MAG: MFS transporter [Lachnospiraceae bacterium]|nr:MFS transporter [Lachnospiraceae bacterium]